MTLSNRNVLACLGALAAIGAPHAAQAGPYILATAITPICQIEANGSVSTVSITLNSTTASFYGTGLNYHFKAADGSFKSFPSPGTAPGRFALPTGSYTLYITTNIDPNYPGASGSPAYTVNVPTFSVLTRGGRKFCVLPRLQNPVRGAATPRL